MNRISRAAVACLLLQIQMLAVDTIPQAQSSTAEQSKQQAQTSSSSSEAPSAVSPTSALPALNGFGLEDGTPIKLRLTRNLSSASDKKGDTVDFEVLEALTVNGITVIPRESVAWATITEAEPKKRMGRGGKLDVNIDNVRLADGEKAPLRAVQENKGGGHVGAMTGAMVATGIVFFPAAPFFLLMHGKDINIPKGTEITAYVAGNIPLDKAKFEVVESVAGPSVAAGTGAPAAVTILSSPTAADIEIDGKFVGNTPSTIPLAAGEHSIKVAKKGYKPWERKLNVAGGATNLSAELEQEQ
jgi:PEGA domain